MRILKVDMKNGKIGFENLEEQWKYISSGVYTNLDMPVSMKAMGIPKEDLKKIAFYTSRDAVNMATDPTSISEQKIFRLLQEIY